MTVGSEVLFAVDGYIVLLFYYCIEFWSSQTANCNTPTECTTASITVIGRDYLANEQTINYTYDDLNRLTAADYSNGMYYHYEYDSVGNRLQQVSAFLADPVTTAYTYDDANRLSTVGGQTYTFDANGNLTSDGTYTYTYDTANRLVGVATAATAVTYRYNGDGNRLQQSSNGVDTNYTLELNSGLSQVLADGANTYLYGMNRLGMSNTTDNYLYEYDALGSVRQMENISGLTLAESYDPYGNVILSSGQARIYGYSGEEQNSNGMIYLRARTYQPFNGTFTSRDTWDGNANLPMSYNKWAYGYNNPVKYTDPSGKNPDTSLTFYFTGMGSGGYNIFSKNQYRESHAAFEKQILDNLDSVTTVYDIYPYNKGTASLIPGLNLFKIIGTALGDNTIPSSKGFEIELDIRVFKAKQEGKNLLDICEIFSILLEPLDTSNYQINLIGFSGGAQIAYSTAQSLNEKTRTDNLVLLFPPYKASKGTKNIDHLWEFLGEKDPVNNTNNLTGWSTYNNSLGIYSSEGNATQCILNGESHGLIVDTNFGGMECKGENEFNYSSSDIDSIDSISKFLINEVKIGE